MTEQQYDEVIAPMLLAVAQKCKELGMAMVARVEWEPGEAGITQMGDNEWSGSQMLAHLACHSHGNIDRLCLTLVKKPGADGSIFLAPFVTRKDTAPARGEGEGK